MEKEKIRVLYLDDEINNLVSFKATFRSIFNVFIANNYQEALSVLEQIPVHIVIADQKMPECTGVDFFETILTKHPHPIRILITAYSDIDCVIKAINKGQIYRYIKKPWDFHEIKMTIENAYEIYRTRQELNLKTEQLEKVNNELTRFVYSTSHDLKAPIMTMLGVMKLTEMEGRNINEDPILSLLNKSIKKLDFFIRNITNYYKNSKIEKRIEEINFSSIVNETLYALPFVEESPIKDVDIDIHIDQKEQFLNDEFRVRVILNNILSNSIKYQKQNNCEKKVGVSIRTESKSAEIRITDNGIGIPKDHVTKIFDMFFRGTSISSGSGIGLYIVKEAVEKIAGSIDVRSEEGEGTEFIISIPNLKPLDMHGASYN